MEFTIAKNDLVRELSLTQGVVEKKTTIPILSNVLLEASEDRLTLTATDLELGIRASCPAAVTREGSGTIPARRLLDYVRLLPESEIQVKVQENHWANLVCGRSRTRMAGMSRESYPELPGMPEPVAQVPAGVLSSMISKTIFSISAEESRFTLNGALLLLKPAAAVMVSTDGHRLSMVEHPLELAGITTPVRALLPRKAMGEILKLAGEAGNDCPVEFALDENHLFFRFGGRLLLSRKLSGSFPDFEKVLPREHARTVNLSREELRAALERVAQFSDERSRAIRVKFTPGEMTIFSSLSDTGESEESLPVEYEGPKVEVGFNAQYLLEFLRAVGEGQVELHFKDAANAGEMRPGGQELSYTYRYVVMPMRI